MEVLKFVMAAQAVAHPAALEVVNFN